MRPESPSNDWAAWLAVIIALSALVVNTIVSCQANRTADEALREGRATRSALERPRLLLNILPLEGTTNTYCRAWRDGERLLIALSMTYRNAGNVTACKISSPASMSWDGNKLGVIQQDTRELSLAPGEEMHVPKVVVWPAPSPDIDRHVSEINEGRKALRMNLQVTYVSAVETNRQFDSMVDFEIIGKRFQYVSRSFP